MESCEVVHAGFSGKDASRTRPLELSRQSSLDHMQCPISPVNILVWPRGEHRWREGHLGNFRQPKGGHCALHAGKTMHPWIKPKWFFAPLKVQILAL